MFWLFIVIDICSKADAVYIYMLYSKLAQK